VRTIGDALVRRHRDSVRVTCVSPRWWFVAILPLPAADYGKCDVLIDIEVSAGQVGVSLLDQDNVTLSSETTVGAGQRKLVRLRDDGGLKVGGLVVRTVDPADRPAVLTLHGVVTASRGDALVPAR
jgi:hypothetical protein